MKTVSLTDQYPELPDFTDVPDGYGEVAFFWWHGDKITREKLLWILDQLKSSHISGLQINYAHSDTGGKQWGLTLKSDPTPLSDEWWDMVGWFLGECKKYHISLSLSDYTLGGPGQGFYTDTILNSYPEYTGQRLIYENGIVHIETVADTMNPIQKGIGQAVIDEFYGKFEEHFPGECGKGINYFFSDELDFHIRGNLWCDDFAEEFLRRKGYDIQACWNALFEDIGSITPKVRLDYYDVIIQLSEERYFKPVFEWHEKRGMVFGCDHGGRGRDVTEFGDYFRMTRWYQGPGNDQPRLSFDIIKNKVASSIAHLYERPRTWLEGFYGSGWGTTSAQVADAVFRNFAMGHNLLSLHGLYYSTQGSMWEWAPPCNHFHMPYWPEMGEFLQCSERLSYILTRGKHVCDVAIFYPVSDMEADPEHGELSVRAAFDAAEILYPQGIDFDFIDFESVERAVVSEQKLCVSGEAYSIVILPNMRAIRFSALEKLHHFACSGGIVMVIGEAPTQSDRNGRDDSVLNQLVGQLRENAVSLKDCNDLIPAIDARICRDFQTDSPSPYIMHRKVDTLHLYYVYNVEKGRKCFFRSKGKPFLLNPWDGHYQAIPSYEETEDGTLMLNPLEASQVLIIVFLPEGQGAPDAREAFSDNKANIAQELIPSVRLKEESISLNEDWECDLVPNLDNTYGDYRLPAFSGYIGAEAREFRFKVTDEDCSAKQLDDSLWRTDFYSVGDYFWILHGTADEEALIAMNRPLPGFRPYHFSMRTGVWDDAGHQGSYHGLKGKISDDFLAFGEKIITCSGSSSTYQGEGPYYFFTNVYVPQTGNYIIHTGEKKPDGLWVDHIPVSLSAISLQAGLHPVLLKFNDGGRTHFVILKKEGTFAQKTPLSMAWFENPDVLTMDAHPEYAGKSCWYRFMSPPGMVSFQLNCTGEAAAWANGREVRYQDGSYYTNRFSPDSVCIALKLRQERGYYGTAAIRLPVSFQCKTGRISIGDWAKLPGLKFYSGGILYRKSVDITHSSKVVLNLGNVVSSARIRINGKEAGILTAPPFETDITGYVKKGSNIIEILVHNTLANHLLTIPTNFNGDSQSGILGPVHLLLS